MSERQRGRVLVTGGAGYIGSHIALDLVRAGFRPVILDNLYSGFSWATLDAEFVRADLGDTRQIDDLLGKRSFDAVIHCAAHIWVGESVSQPAKYYANNTANSIRLFDLCARHRIRAVVMSSTAAVYGEPAKALIDEETPLQPINPYGASKAMAERVLIDVASGAGGAYGILRYFNVAGADPKGRIGEATPDNAHLIKLACETALGRRSAMYINGSDYPTPDGTCIRDYVHVSDLASAHVLLLEHLLGGGGSLIMNCGYGRGFSVREVLESVQRVTGVRFRIEERERRPGDPPELVADSRRIVERLQWRPRFDDLDTIIDSAWQWEQKVDQVQAAASRSS